MISILLGSSIKDELIKSQWGSVMDGLSLDTRALTNEIGNDVRKDRGIDLSIDLDLVSLEGPAVNRRANMTDVALMRSVTMQRHAADDSHCRKSAPREPRPDVFGSLNWHEVKRSHWHCLLSTEFPILIAEFSIFLYLLIININRNSKFLNRNNIYYYNIIYHI